MSFSAHVGSPTCGTGASSPAARVDTRSSTPASTRRFLSPTAVSRGPICTSVRAWMPPMSKSSPTAITHTPVVVSPDRTAHSTGAGPRHRGSEEKCTFTMGNTSRIRVGINAPKATTTPRSAPQSTRVPMSCATGRPRSLAAALTGLGDGSSRRPRRRSSPVITRAISCPASTRAMRNGAANSGVPRKASRVGCAGGGAVTTMAKPDATPRLSAGGPPAGPGPVRSR